MYLERLMPGLLGDPSSSIDTFGMMQQQGMQAAQDGMQAQNSLAQARASALQAFQQQQAEDAAKEKAAMNIGLALATGGLGGGAAAGTEAAGATGLSALTKKWMDDRYGTGFFFPMR